MDPSPPQDPPAAWPSSATSLLAKGVPSSQVARCAVVLAAGRCARLPAALGSVVSPPVTVPWVLLLVSAGPALTPLALPLCAYCRLRPTPEALPTVPGEHLGQQGRERTRGSLHGSARTCFSSLEGEQRSELNKLPLRL